MKNNKELYKELLELKEEYSKSGKYGALNDLAKKYGVEYRTFQARIRPQQKYHKGINDTLELVEQGLKRKEVIDKLIYLL